MKEIFTALITPFNQDQSIDYPALYRIIDKLIDEGNKSFYCVEQLVKHLHLN